MRATLYAVPGSHPSLAAQLMLERKGIEVRRIDLVAAVHRGVVRAAGFPGITVPAVRLDGSRIQGTGTIARALDALVPEPPLLPSDPVARAKVERVEGWADEVYQSAARRLAWATIKRDRSSVGSFLEGARLGIPTSVAARTATPVIFLSARLNRASDEAVRRDLAALPGWLDRIDGWLAEGVLGGSDPNVADYQVATSTRLLLAMDDLRPRIEDRPAGRHAVGLVPSFPGRVSSVLPADWL
jgi:glutathione S-transferase